MKYLIQWELQAATFRDAVGRFLTTGGVPPQGVTLVGRWHGTNGTGCAVVDAPDAKSVFAYLAEWMEFFPIEATPLVEDGEAAEVLASLYR